MKLPNIEYDKETDILTIDLAEPDQIVHTLEFDGATGVVIQFGDRHTPISIEIFDASKRYPKSILNRVKARLR